MNVLDIIPINQTPMLLKIQTESVYLFELFEASEEYARIIKRRWKNVRTVGVQPNNPQAMETDKIEIEGEIKLTIEEYDTLLFFSRIENFQPNDIIITEGKPNSKLYQVLQGSVKCQYNKDESRLITKGSHFGLDTILSGDNSLYSIIAQDEVKVCFLDYSRLLLLRDIDSTLGIKFWQYLTSKL